VWVEGGKRIPVGVCEDGGWWAISRELRTRWLALAARVVAVMLTVRSKGELPELPEYPYILCAEHNLNPAEDGEHRMALAVVCFQEHARGFDRTENLRMRGSMTGFVTAPMQEAGRRKQGTQAP
jgi:hypothetical protein